MLMTLKVFSIVAETLLPVPISCGVYGFDGGATFHSEQKGIVLDLRFRHIPPTRRRHTHMPPPMRATRLGRIR